MGKGFVYWTPWIAGIALMLFLALFSFDVFDSASGFWQIALGLLIHNTPVFIMAVFLIIAWKHELVGAIAFGAAGLFYIVFMIFNAITEPFAWYGVSYSLIIAGPAFIIAYFFYLNWRRKGKGTRSSKK